MTAAALVLAAGASTRYRAAGGRAPSKLVATFEGEPMVRAVARAAIAAGCTPVVVVTGHARDAVEAALAGLPVGMVHNGDFASGLASSLRGGLLALDEGVEAAVVLLGDMPRVGADTIAILVSAAAAHPEAQAVVPVSDGVRGNPVLLRRALFPAAGRLTGDEGARRLLRDPSIVVHEVSIEGEAVRLDLDEPGALLA